MQSSTPFIPSILSSVNSDHPVSGTFVRQANPHLSMLCRDEMHCVLQFLKFEDLQAASLSHSDWMDSLRSLKPRRDGAGVEVILTPEIWQQVRDYPNSALLPHVTMIKMNFCPQQPQLLSRLFPSLESIWCHGWSVPAIASFPDVTAFARAMTELKHLTKVKFEDCQLGYAIAASIADVIKHCKNVTSVDLAGNHIVSTGLGFASSTDLVLKPNPFGNPIGDIGVVQSDNLFDFYFNPVPTAVLDDLKKLDSIITSLDLHMTQIPYGILYIAAAIKENKHLTNLSLCGTLIGHLGAWLIADALGQHESMTNVDLRCCGIGDVGASFIADAIGSSTSLTSISLNCNRIGNVGASWIADAILRSKSFTSVELSVNEICDRGASSIARAISQSKSLTNVDLSYNHIHGNGASSIAGAIKQSQSLTGVSLSGNYFSSVGVSAITDAIAQSKRLIDVDFDADDYAEDESDGDEFDGYSSFEDESDLSIAEARGQTMRTGRSLMQ